MKLLARMLLRIEALNRQPVRLHLVGIVILCGGFLLGLWFNRSGILNWDDWIQYEWSKVALAAYGFGQADFETYYYAIFWELLLGFATEYLFTWLHDPFVVRHALTFALFPFTLFYTYFLLRRAGVASGPAFLSTVMVFGIIRFGGHSLTNVKDFPAAALFLLSTLWMWVLFLRAHQEVFSRYRTLVALGVWAALPFVVRVPLLLPVVLLTIALLYVVCFDSRLSLKRRIVVLLLPLCTSLVTIVALYPPFWTWNLQDWLVPFWVFSRFDIQIFQTQIFGITLSSDAIPWWYGMAWLPVLMEPLTFLLCIAGLAYLLARRARLPGLRSLSLGKRRNWTIVHWLGWVVILSWAGILIASPRLYDEERHLLFLYPVTVLFCSLGLVALRTKYQSILTGLILLSSLYAYGRWQEYSYVYVSPLIPNRSSSQFLGDYWGTCITESLRALPKFAPAGSAVLTYIDHYAFDQTYRLHTSRLFGDSAYPDYELLWKLDGVPDTPYYSVTLNRLEDPLAPLQESARKPLLIHTVQMPLGDVACATFWYPRAGLES